MDGAKVIPALIPGVILAGGRSRRMGTDKAFVLLHGRPLIAHVLARLTPQVSAVAINGDPAALAMFARPVLPDSVGGQPGPLAGVLAALGWAAKQGRAYVLTVPVDTPLLPFDLAVRLGRGGVARSGGRLHPVIATWPVSARTLIAAALARGENRVGVVAAEVGLVPVEFAEAALRNLNTPGDVAQLASASR